MHTLGHSRPSRKRGRGVEDAIINKVDKDVFVPAYSIHLFIISCSALQSYLEPPWSDQYQVTKEEEEEGEVKSWTTRTLSRGNE
jgi:hypothetical protein